MTDMSKGTGTGVGAGASTSRGASAGTALTTGISATSQAETGARRAETDARLVGGDARPAETDARLVEAATCRRGRGPAASVRHFTLDCDGETLSVAEAVPGVPAPEPLTAVVLHGAGNGDKQSPTVLAAHLAARGHHALAFDFSGHGASTGVLSELSLRRRFEQARTVIDTQLPAHSRLLLIGFSMSGQTVADLTAHYGPRVAAIGLGAPAVYAARAWPVPFGAGFTGIIRTPESWRGSPALDVFRGLPGTLRAVLAVPAVDAVIPPAVTEAVDEALAASDAHCTRLVLPAADHRLSVWFAGDAVSRGEFVDALLGAGETYGA